MNLKEYQKLCKRTAREFSAKEKEIMTWGLGIAGEARDVAGCIKKIFSHRSPDSPGHNPSRSDLDGFFILGMWYN